MQKTCDTNFLTVTKFPEEPLFVDCPSVARHDLVLGSDPPEDAAVDVTDARQLARHRSENTVVK